MTTKSKTKTSRMIVDSQLTPEAPSGKSVLCATTEAELLKEAVAAPPLSAAHHGISKACKQNALKASVKKCKSTTTNKT